MKFLEYVLIFFALMLTLLLVILNSLDLETHIMNFEIVLLVLLLVIALRVESLYVAQADEHTKKRSIRNEQKTV